MNMERLAREMNMYSSNTLFNLFGDSLPEKEELVHLGELLKIRPGLQPGSRTQKIIILPSRARYIRQHQHEGLFFQQRYQAAYNDQGEVVRDILEKEWVNSELSEVEKWKYSFELEEIWDKPIIQLSSGEWQRFSICKSLVSKPDILIAKGGLNGLDERWQQKIFDILTDRITSVQRLIITSDQPVNHPAVINIKVDTKPQFLSAHKKFEIPETLKESFIQYQSLFLDPIRKDEVIRMNGVNITYGGRKILDQISWVVHAQDKWNIHGPNGAGKSTLLSLVNADNPQGYSQPVELFGQRYGHFSIWVRKSRIAYFGSDYFQYFRSSKSAEQVLSQQLRTPYQDTMQPPQSLIDESLSFFGLSDYRKTAYNRLSPTRRRQLLLIGSYLKSSDVLVLDEPYQDFLADDILRNNALLEDVLPHSAQTVLFVTHREDHKPRFLDKVLEIDHGRSRIIQ